jgi:hypothetical protein
MISYNNVELWELQPVELIARTRPASTGFTLPAPEQTVLEQEGVDLATFREFLKERNLAVVVSRNVTSRDKGDKQQPFNLRIPGSTTQTIGASGRMYDVSLIQFFQGDLLRGIGGASDPRDGRRVLARPMHDLGIDNPHSSTIADAAVSLGADGSMAAFVPARRAMSWQLLSPDGSPIVRERYWLTFQPGEIRVCASCHGVNKKDQAGQAAPTNLPLALRSLLNVYKGAPAPQLPQYTLTLKKRTKKISALKAGDKFTLLIAGTNAASHDKEVNLKITVGSCTIEKSFSADSEGAKTFQLNLSPQAKKGKVKFQLVYNSGVVGQTTAKVSAKPKAKKKKVSCAALLKVK